jgi:hypothetical protein
VLCQTTADGIENCEDRILLLLMAFEGPWSHAGSCISLASVLFNKVWARFSLPGSGVVRADTPGFADKEALRGPGLLAA